MWSYRIRKVSSVQLLKEWKGWAREKKIGEDVAETCVVPKHQRKGEIFGST